MRKALRQTVLKEAKMADDDDKLDTHKHHRKKTGTPEWSETCIGFWSKTYKEIHGKENEEQRRCRGISILHLNKVYHSIHRAVNVLQISEIRYSFCVCSVYVIFTYSSLYKVQFNSNI